MPEGGSLSGNDVDEGCNHFLPWEMKNLSAQFQNIPYICA